jgi:hypothetical protein
MTISKQPQALWHTVRQQARKALDEAGKPRSRHRLLGIYLNDHLAGATAGTELARRVAGSGQESGDPAVLRRLAGQISADRQSLLDIMDTLDVPVQRYKTGLAWFGEKAARLKLNGQLVNRSPLSSLEELEMLRLGVEGKAAGWRTLRELADLDHRLDQSRLDDLIGRARDQADLLERLRVEAASQILQPSA